MKPRENRGLKANVRTKRADSSAAIQEMTILSVSGEPDDHKTLQRILGDSGWTINTARTWQAATGHLKLAPFPIVICENHVVGGSWKDFFNASSRSLIPRVLIVTSRFADDYLWAEVLNLGGYDVLSKPFSEQEVRRVITSAWSAVTGTVRVRAAGYAG